MNTVLHAGSLYKNYLILYGENTIISIQVDNHDAQWDIYCKDVEVLEQDDTHVILQVEGKEYTFPYRVTPNPMKDLGFS